MKDLKFEDAKFTTVIFKDGKLQLLLKLMGAERFGERGALPLCNANSRRS